MRKIACLLMLIAAAPFTSKAQSRDWMTDSADAQRSAWIRRDDKISPESMQKPGFQLVWKMRVRNLSRQMNSLTPPATLDRLIGYRGFRMLGFFGGSNNSIFTIDTDLGRMEWEKNLKAVLPASPGTLSCPMGMTTGIVRPTVAAIPAIVTGGGGGRSNPAKSAVGQPGQGAVTLANVRPNPPASAPAPAPRPTPTPARPNPANPPGGQFGSGPFLVYALAGDGKLHAMHLSNGEDYKPPVQFVPPNANASGLTVIETMAYAVTQKSCGDAPNGLWAMDLVSGQVVSWKANIAGSAGPAFSGDGSLFVATESGGGHPNSVVSLDAVTLEVKAAYSAGDSPFSSSPVIFRYRDRVLLAAATRDGRIHLLDTANISKPLSVSAVASNAGGAGEFVPGALSSWQDNSGTRWILAPTTGSVAAGAGFNASNGQIKNGSVIAWKIVEENGAPTIKPGWASRDLVSPLPPTIINGVVFVTSSGEYRTNARNVTASQRVLKSSRAVLYALDGATGRELWNSGTAISSFTRGNALSGGMGQIYVTTHDGTIYAFGFPMEH